MFYEEKNMKIAEYAIRYRTLTLVLTALLTLGGVVSYYKLGQLEDPEFTIKKAIVTTSYPGASPKEVEEEVTDIIETAIQQLPQVDHVRSISRRGFSLIFVDIKDQYVKETLPQIWDELRRKVNDAQYKLPLNAGKSIVNDDFGDVYGIFFAITGDGYSYKEIKDYADMLRKELLLVEEVAKVEIFGAQQEAIYIEIARSKMSQLGISPQLIVNTLNQKNLIVSSGKIKIGKEYVPIKVTGGFSSIKQIGNLLIRSNKSNQVVYLKDVAKDIRRGYIEPPSTLLRYNGKLALGIGISIVSGGNVVKMGNAVSKRIEELKVHAPVGMELGIISYQSQSVSKAIGGFVENLIQSLIIVITLLVICMGVRVGFLIGGILLLTILSTFVVMDYLRINLQAISLGALIIALGMLVDNAIVVAEGILIKIQCGMEKVKAANQTVNETIWPLLGATIVAILAFAAIGVSQDSTGEYLRSLFQVVAISLFLSWLLAVTVTPLFCVMVLKVPEQKSKDPYAGFFYKLYAQFLQFCLQKRGITIGILFILLGLSAYGFGYVKRSFFPDMSRPQFIVDYWKPEGTHIEEVVNDIALIEKYALKLKGIENVSSFIGRGALRFILTYDQEMPNQSFGQLLITVKNHEEIDALRSKMREYIQNNFPSAQPKVKRFVYGPGGGSKIEARFSGPDPNILRSISQRVKEIMSFYPQASVIRDNWRQRVKNLRVRTSQIQLRKTGIARPGLSNILQMNFTGLTVGIYREENKLLPIIMRAPKDERDNVNEIHNIQVLSPISGKTIPIHQVISGFDEVWEDPIIRRRDRKRTITVQCDPLYGTADSLFRKLRPQIEAIKLPDGYELEWGGEYEKSTRAKRMLFGNVPIAFLLMIVIVIALFNALRQPIIIFLCLPLAVIGVTAGLLITDRPFGFVALLGFLSLSGMLIKNAIVLLDQIEIEKKEGKSIYQAILDSAVSRVRPVTMAAFTTVLGMIPLVFDVFFSAMAVTIMAGLTFATVLTLIVVPVFYAVFFRVHHLED